MVIRAWKRFQWWPKKHQLEQFEGIEFGDILFQLPLVDKLIDGHRYLQVIKVVKKCAPRLSSHF